VQGQAIQASTFKVSTDQKIEALSEAIPYYIPDGLSMMLAPVLASAGRAKIENQSNNCNKSTRNARIELKFPIAAITTAPRVAPTPCPNKNHGKLLRRNAIVTAAPDVDASRA